MNKDEKTQEPLLDHEYDGIRELDNPLPKWWLWTFYGSVVFATIYFIVFHVLDLFSIQKEYDADIAAIQAHQAQKTASRPQAPDASTLESYGRDPARIERGKAVYTTNCLACHGADGGGSIGPNLTDAYWLHGDGGMAALVDVIGKGVPEKGMPPWASVLRDEQLPDVAAFVYSLRGTKPAAPKAPQGNLVK